MSDKVLKLKVNQKIDLREFCFSNRNIKFYNIKIIILHFSV